MPHRVSCVSHAAVAAVTFETCCVRMTDAVTILGTRSLAPNSASAPCAGRTVRDDAGPLHPVRRLHVTHSTVPGSGPSLLVGRSRERSLLGAQLSAALAGQGGLVILSGEAGIGKT